MASKMFLEGMNSAKEQRRVELEEFTKGNKTNKNHVKK